MNMSIRCQVTECKYNDNNEHYCTLNKVEIVKSNKGNINTIQGTDCGNFELK